MANCPDYRLRLFLSVDLVGSTAYKTRFGDIETHTQQPAWVSKLRAFYRDFPEMLGANYERVKSGQRPDSNNDAYPKVWKTVGDEILFCCRVRNVHHLALCVQSFLEALEEYGRHLEGDTKGSLDVKGAGWIAAFPAPNVTVNLPNQAMKEVERDENFEAAADADPSRFDFLGQSIDAGFRICRNAASDHFSASAELAYLLAHKDVTFKFDFNYLGRQVFKGVIANRPYPVVTIYTERRGSRRDVREKEKAILPSNAVSCFAVRDFLEVFLQDEVVEKPVLPLTGNADATSSSPTYDLYKAAWSPARKEDTQRDSLLVSAENKADGTDTDFQDIDEAARQTISELKKPTISDSSIGS